MSRGTELRTCLTGQDLAVAIRATGRVYNLLSVCFSFFILPLFHSHFPLIAIAFIRMSSEVRRGRPDELGPIKLRWLYALFPYWLDFPPGHLAKAEKSAFITRVTVCWLDIFKDLPFADDPLVAPDGPPRLDTIPPPIRDETPEQKQARICVFELT
jgi:hypothetical protein